MMTPDNVTPPRLLNKRQLLELVSISYTKIWELMKRGEFPISVRIGSRVYWRLDEIEVWLAELPRSQYGAHKVPSKRLTGADQ